MATRRLPKKLSKRLPIAIRQAIHDQRLCEKDIMYKVDMGVFHTPWFNLSCSVCLAGGIMAKRLGADRTRHCLPMDYSTEIENMLLALDEIRRGRMGQFVLEVKIPTIQAIFKSKSMFWLRKKHYACNPGKFKRCLLRVADMLERRGY